MLNRYKVYLYKDPHLNEMKWWACDETVYKGEVDCDFEDKESIRTMLHKVKELEASPTANIRSIELRVGEDIVAGVTKKDMMPLFSLIKMR